MREQKKTGEIPFSKGAVLVALGVVYGDIGTSPMYVMKSILAENGGIGTVSEELILGSLSLIIWTLTLLTTVKYVLVAMKADNHGEGGIFALYSLIKKCGRWLIVPAMIGGAALLADGILTPAVTVTTAVEGLRSIPEIHELLGSGQSRIVLITLFIITILFLVQKAGTSMIGKAFGPLMTIWFLFLASVGIFNMSGDFTVLRALNPLRGIGILFSDANKEGIMILGSVFLATTGAEALYSDMGHVGRKNIYASWPFVKVCLLLNYFGQGAWLLRHEGSHAFDSIEDMNPFFEMLPDEIRMFAVVLSTIAAIIASQALITGSFTLVSEATRLDLMPRMRIIYPSQTKGQSYIPLVNLVLWISCTLVILYFRSSARLEAAYGLAITITMLMTTLLLFTYLWKKKGIHVVSILFLLLFGGLEGSFFVSSLSKFARGGYVALLIAILLFLLMVDWYYGTYIERSQACYMHIRKYVPMFERLRTDSSVYMASDNVVYITHNTRGDIIDRDVLYSIFNKIPKRSKAYWIVSVIVTDEPYTNEYTVESFGTDYLFRVRLFLGFKVHQRINVHLRQIVTDLIASGELPPQAHQYSIYEENGSIGNFRFYLIHKVLSPECDITSYGRAAIAVKYAIRHIAGSYVQWYGLENSSVGIENVPLFVKLKKLEHLQRRIDEEEGK